MNQAETMHHQTTDVLPTAMYHLQQVGCDTIDPLTLTLAVWQGERIDLLKTAADRQHFQALHLAACQLLGAEPHAPDLRPVAQRNKADIKQLADAYRWAGKAHHSHADALKDYFDQRKQA